MQRYGNRSYDQVRSLSVTYGVFPYADGSVLFEMGNTKVFVAVTLQSSVPSFLRGKKTGWLTAEYSLLPTSTQVRNLRESSGQRSGRSIEISRFIGRVLRSVCNLGVLGERTVTIDCDVLQADGSTRAAAINGALLALQMANHKWIKKGSIASNCLSESLVAVSVGVIDDRVLLDIDYQEDVAVDADFTFVLTQTNNIIEIHGAAERKACTWELHQHAYALACKGAMTVRDFCDQQPCMPGSAASLLSKGVAPQEHGL